MFTRLCGMCEKLSNRKACKDCGADTDKLPRPVSCLADLFEDRDEAYERAAARYDGQGRDWR